MKLLSTVDRRDSGGLLVMHFLAPSILPQCQHLALFNNSSFLNQDILNYFCSNILSSPLRSSWAHFQDVCKWTTTTVRENLLTRFSGLQLRMILLPEGGPLPLSPTVTLELRLELRA